MVATTSVTEQLGLVVTVLTSVRKATDSNLGVGTDSSVWFFVSKFRCGRPLQD
jgi:hypothetical protein